MAFFLKAVSGIYLILIWVVTAVALSRPVPIGSQAYVGNNSVGLLIVLTAIGLSIPAVVMFGFAQIVGDVRIMRINSRAQREHLEAMRRYYEPQR